MRLLVLGGTVFLGRHVVEAALARGDEVTLFNRGRSGHFHQQLAQADSDQIERLDNQYAGSCAVG